MFRLFFFSLFRFFSFFIWRIYLSIFSTNGFLHKSSLGSTFIRALLSLVSKNRLFIIFLFDLVEWHRYSSHLISVFLNHFHFVALWCITDLHVITILVSKWHQKTPFKSDRIVYIFSVWIFVTNWNYYTVYSYKDLIELSCVGVDLSLENSEDLPILFTFFAIIQLGLNSFNFSCDWRFRAAPNDLFIPRTFNGHSMNALSFTSSDTMSTLFRNSKQTTSLS